MQELTTLFFIDVAIVNDLQQKTVLIVASSPNWSSQLANRLSDFGYICVCVTTPADAMNTLDRQVFSAVFSQLDFTGMNGWQLARVIRSGVSISDWDTPILLGSPAGEHSPLTLQSMSRAAEVQVISSPPSSVQDVAQMIDEMCRLSLEAPERTILVVEDDADTRDLVGRVLGDSYKITFVGAGDEALDIYNPGKFDLILLDIMLPVISGKAVLVNILRQDADQVIIVMTADTRMAEAEFLILAGAADFICKPFRNRDLKKRIDSVFEYMKLQNDKKRH